MNNYKALHDSLIKDFKGKDFVLAKKMLKHHRIYKFCVSTSFVILGASLIPSLSNDKFTIAITGVAGILFFENKMRNIKDFLHDDKNCIEENFKKYLNSAELIEFRQNKLNELELNSITKRDYLILIKEELQLIYNLIKSECENESKIDIITYKNDVEHIFETLNFALDNNLINKEDLKAIKKKWSSDIQSLCNQYVKTELEIDLKYLQCMHEIKK